MKYTSELTINLPRERVIELFDNPKNLPKWQTGLQSYKPISGEPGQPGAKSHLVYEINGRTIEMEETILTRNLPDEFSGTYETKGVWNQVNNHFNENGAGNTRWVLESEFKFSGLMAVMAFIMPGAFKKQTLKEMNQFKQFAENA